MAPLALVLLVQERTGSLAAAGLASGAWGLGVAFGQPLWAGPAGRGRAERVIAAVATAQAVTLAGLALTAWTDAWLPITAAAVAGLLGAPITSVARTLWPELAGDARGLDRLFTLDATTQEAIWIAGPALVGLLLSVASAEVALLATCAAGGLGGLWFAAVVRPLWRPHPTPDVRQPIVGLLIVPWLGTAVMTVGLGAAEVAVPAAAIAAGQRESAGWLLAVWSLGSLVGGLVAARFPSDRDPAERIPVFLVALAVGGTITAATWTTGTLWLALVLFVSGLGLAPALASVYGVVARLVDADRRTRAYAIGTTFALAGLAFGAALGGALAEVSPTWAFAAGAIAPAAAAVVWWVWLQRTRSTRASSQTGSGAS
jgi:MFS family permease